MIFLRGVSSLSSPSPCPSCNVIEFVICLTRLPLPVYAPKRLRPREKTPTRYFPLFPYECGPLLEINVGLRGQHIQHSNAFDNYQTPTLYCNKFRCTGDTLCRIKRRWCWNQEGRDRYLIVILKVLNFSPHNYTSRGVQQITVIVWRPLAKESREYGCFYSSVQLFTLQHKSWDVQQNTFTILGLFHFKSREYR